MRKKEGQQNSVPDVQSTNKGKYNMPSREDFVVDAPKIKVGGKLHGCILIVAL